MVCRSSEFWNLRRENGDSPPFNSALMRSQMAKNYGKPVVRNDCQVTLPCCRVKMAARTDCTSRDGFSFLKRGKNPAGNSEMTICTFLSAEHSGEALKLYQSCSKGGHLLR